MSRIGKKPVSVIEGVTVNVKEDVVEVKGPNATLQVPLLDKIEVKVEDGAVTFTPHNKTKQTRSNWGTMRSLVESAIKGAKENFTKTLLIEGVGYKANMEGTNLVLNLGFSHSIKFPVPEGVNIEVEGNNKIVVSGADKAQVGQAAATIRKFKKPEPYKGKGIRYDDEVVRRKAGKKAVGSGGA